MSNNFKLSIIKLINNQKREKEQLYFKLYVRVTGKQYT